MEPVVGRSIPDPGFFAKYGVNVTEMDDIGWEPIYDHLAYPAAGVNVLGFFANGVNQGATSVFGAAAGPKTFSDTNLESNNGLPVPERALIVGISCEIYTTALPGRGTGAAASTGTNWNDLYEIGRTGFLSWFIGQKRITIQAPVMKFGSAASLGGAASVATATAADLTDQIDYAYISSPIYGIVPVAIPSSQNFPLNLNFPTLVAVTDVCRIGICLHGYRIRKPQ